MSTTSRTVARLLWCYPARWRARYGDELGALILDMSEGGQVPWRVRLDVAGAGTRERLAAAFGGRQDQPERRMLGGTLLVLWAWTLFVLGGAVVAKTSEHWNDAVPGSASSVSTTAYSVLTVGAVLSAMLVLAGVGWALPGFVALLRTGGWRRIRCPVLLACATAVLAVAATVGVEILAGSMGKAHHVSSGIAYVAFLGWALVAAACLCTWTAAAAATARQLDLSALSLRVETWVASGIAVAMVMMTVATAIWWLTVARVAPGALTGGPAGARGSAFVPALALALLVMVLATLTGAEGARRALTAQRG